MSEVLTWVVYKSDPTLEGTNMIRISTEIEKPIIIVSVVRKLILLRGGHMVANILC